MRKPREKVAARGVADAEVTEPELVHEQRATERAEDVAQRSGDEVQKHVAAGTALYTDELLSYDGLANDYAHKVIDHAEAYVDGRVHTNSLENFWSLLKRGISGTYVSVEPFHLFRYLDEEEFRFNNRGTRENPITDGDRFDMAVKQIVGKRLTFDQLTGKTLEGAAQPF